MQCPQCRLRPAKRLCPALGRRICATCCATMRQVEIRCPFECPYLVSARHHPSAADRRQVASDSRVLGLMVEGLTPDQEELLSLLVAVVTEHPADALLPLTDADVADATAALAATYETAGRGVIYEHRAESAGGRRLAADLERALDALAQQGGSRLHRDAPIILRRLERGAREARSQLGGSETAFLGLLGRIVRAGPPGGPEDAAASPSSRLPGSAPGSRLIVPGR